MASINGGSVLFFFLTFTTMVTNLHADIAEFDDFLKKKAELALEASLKAYNPNPEEVAENFNKQVGDSLHLQSYATQRVQVTKRDYAMESEWKDWQWRSEGDKFINGAFFVESGPPLKDSPSSGQKMIKHKPGSYAGRLTRYAGRLKCTVGQPC
ncbi:unnamed protein product [Ilex paraguariensis]|uniref:Pectate lyase N-terminal domain-containing protein n=1 Tax=Ilex paraguariensis TaxID=185542 RepID=A0ABC8TRZ4_9AQUA